MHNKRKVTHSRTNTHGLTWRETETVDAPADTDTRGLDRRGRVNVALCNLMIRPLKMVFQMDAVSILIFLMFPK